MYLANHRILLIPSMYSYEYEYSEGVNVLNVKGLTDHHKNPQMCLCPMRDYCKMRWIRHDNMGSLLENQSDGRATTTWIQPSFKQKWQSQANELD